MHNIEIELNDELWEELRHWPAEERDRFINEALKAYFRNAQLNTGSTRTSPSMSNSFERDINPDTDIHD
jgi:hypothetical protein